VIRIGHALWLALPIAAGVGLFEIKFQVQALEEELTGLRRKIVQHQDAIHVLHAEWSYLNAPGRLAELSRRHLELAPIAPVQLGRLDDLPEPLPSQPDPTSGPALLAGTGLPRPAAGEPNATGPTVPDELIVRARSTP